MRILANDGLEKSAIERLTTAGHEVVTDKVAQDQLSAALAQFDGIIVRSATTVRKDVIAANPHLKFIARAGVGIDNIDHQDAQAAGIPVINTPAASSISVAELVFSHLFSGVRFLHQSNRSMPDRGLEAFNALKKDYAGGVELFGKTLGIVGLGRIGREAARIALGVGMSVLAFDPFIDANNQKAIEADFPGLKFADWDHLIANVHFLSLHVPGGKEALFGAKEFAAAKHLIGIVNCARGGVIDESALLDALNNGQLLFAGLDVFVGEPKPKAELLQHPRISLTPHIGASTNEAQQRIGAELVDKILSL